MIPKKIHYCWFSQDPLGDLQKKCLYSWKKYLPDYELIHWKIHDLPINIDYVKNMVQKKRWAFLSDYIRLYALYHHGGIYLDLDVEVLKSFNDLLNHKVFLAWENKDIYCEILEAHVIGSVSKHPYIKDCMRFYENNFWLKISHPPVISFMLIQQAEKYNYIRGSRKNCHNKGIEINQGIQIFPYQYFTPLHFKNTEHYKQDKYLKLIDQISYTIHHYESNWHASGLEHIKNLPWAFMSLQEWKKFLIYFFGAIYRNRKRWIKIIFKK